MQHLKFVTILTLIALFVSGFWSGKSPKEVKEESRNERVERIKTSNETLQLLYKYAPEAKNIILRSYGYATFSNIGVITPPPNNLKNQQAYLTLGC